MNFPAVRQHRRAAGSLPRGYSLIEMMTVVAIVGILSAVAVPLYRGVVEESRIQLSEDKKQMLNRAIRAFSQTNWQIQLSADDTSAADELAVLRTLQWRDPLDPAPGAPYVNNLWNPVPSASTKDYRLRWTGASWEALQPGTAGIGLKVDMGGGDLGKPINFAEQTFMTGPQTWSSAPAGQPLPADPQPTPPVATGPAPAQPVAMDPAPSEPQPAPPEPQPAPSGKGKGKGKGN